MNNRLIQSGTGVVTNPEPKVVDDTSHLGIDAQAVIGALFIVQPFAISFRMVELRPTKRFQDALDHLVRAGIIVAEPINGGPGVKYRGIVRFSTAEARKCRALAMENAMPMTEPIS